MALIPIAFLVVSQINLIVLLLQQVALPDQDQDPLEVEALEEEVVVAAAADGENYFLGYITEFSCGDSQISSSVKLVSMSSTGAPSTSITATRNPSNG